MTRRTRENLVYAGVALGSLSFLIWVIPAFTPPYPGYGVSAAALPDLVMSVILGLSLLSLFRNLLEYRREKSKETLNREQNRLGGIPQKDRVNLWHLARFMVPFILLMPAMKSIGFVPAGLLFMLLMQYLCGQRKLLTMVLVAVGTVGLVYGVMRYGLKVPMP